MVTDESIAVTDEAKGVLKFRAACQGWKGSCRDLHRQWRVTAGSPLNMRNSFDH